MISSDWLRMQRVGVPAGIVTGEFAELGKLVKRAIESALPYRDRVEMFGLRDGKVLGGYYANDKNHGVFGGGVDPGETPEQAGAREFIEEAGYRLDNPRLLPVPPVVHDWKPPYASVAQAERAKQFRGSRSFYGTGDVGDPVPEEERGPDMRNGDLQNIRFRSLHTALKRTTAKRGMNREATQGRRQALRMLLGK